MPAPQPVIVAPFGGDALAASILDEVAPAASLELLVGANQHVLHALTAPYVVTALTFEAANTAGTRWHYAQRLNLGARALRGWFCLGVVPSTGGNPTAVSAFSSSSGSSASDEVTVEWEQEGSALYPPGPIPLQAKSSTEDEASPSAAMDRLFELFVTDAEGGSVSGATDEPYCEAFEVANTHGVGGVLQVVADVSGL